jgi:hypothetical protein
MSPDYELTWMVHRGDPYIPIDPEKNAAEIAEARCLTLARVDPKRHRYFLEGGWFINSTKYGAQIQQEFEGSSPRISHPSSRFSKGEHMLSEDAVEEFAIGYLTFKAAAGKSWAPYATAAPAV